VVPVEPSADGAAPAASEEASGSRNATGRTEPRPSEGQQAQADPDAADQDAADQDAADQDAAEQHPAGVPDPTARSDVDGVRSEAGGARHAPPGALTVRAGLGAPRLHVTVEGRSAGWTPVTMWLLEPGEHTVTVASDDSPTPQTRRSYTFGVGSQEEVVLTFDLRRPTPSVARRAYRN
jgi:hypothetical protein